MTTIQLDQIFDVLGDGQWHNIHELQTKITVPFDKTMKALRFLENVNLVEVWRNEDGTPYQWRLSASVTEWYIKTK